MKTTTWEMVTRAIETGIVGYHKKLLHDQAFGVGRARAVYQGQVQCGTTAVVRGPSRAFGCILEASYWSLSYAAWKQTLICTGTLCAHWMSGRVWVRLCSVPKACSCTTCALNLQPIILCQHVHVAIPFAEEPCILGARGVDVFNASP
jgi:hypothetical protein